jgi:anti-sigma-K factor RskA
VKLQRHELHTLTGSYAVDALPDAEFEKFERHLRRCPSCAAEVRGLRETSARLALAAAGPPPAGLRERVLAAAEQTRQLPPLTEERPVHRRRARRAPRAWIPRLSVAVAAVSVAVAVTLGITQATTQNQLNRANAHNRAIAGVLAAPDAQIRTKNTSVGGYVTAVVAPRERDMVITASGLPRLSGSRVYELWMMGPAGARPSGLLGAPQNGQSPPVLASGLTAGVRLGVTIEPAGGTQQPTTSPILTLPLPA